MPRAKPPFPINLIWNVKAFYVTFIVVMIASLAAVGLAPGLGSTGSSRPAPVEEGTPVAEETPTLTSFDAPDKTIDAAKGYEAVITTDKGEIVIALNADAPQAANSFAFLAGHNFYDGLQFFWVQLQPGFVAQAGDPTCSASGENVCTGVGSPGYTLPVEQTKEGHVKWAVVAPATIDGQSVHGSQFRILLEADPRLDGRETVFGQVVEGQEILAGLEARLPCFGAEPSESNPCHPDDHLPEPLTIRDVVVQPAT